MADQHVIKIVVVNGSPRKESDSATLASHFCDGLTGSGVKTEVIRFDLHRMDVRQCTGCQMCTRSGVCMHDDDMMAIRKALSDSDLVVFSSPVHFNHVSSSFQNFVERSLVDLHVFEYVGRPFVNIISTNGSGEGDVDKYMTRIGILFGMVRLGMCYTSKNDEFDQRGFLRLIDKTKSILQDRRLRPTVVNSLYFNSMKKIILKNSTFFEYEKKVWMERGWFEKSFKQIFNEKRQI